MSDEQFKALCNVYGFAPSRALRELIDCVRMQEIEECAKVCDARSDADGWEGAYADECAHAIRARKDKQ